ncbi:LuxR C-terminal-related transcriptional regulator [Kibdelosporangium phytohabitans]|uniref:response regulator transcription factor n=1 Tax=Kibdelosporangium phytohabitans TaxID=860235 RepID=UPI0009FB8F08
MSNPGIAAELFIAEATVKTHLLRIFKKLGVPSRTAAVVTAKERGLACRADGSRRVAELQHQRGFAVDQGQADFDLGEPLEAEGAAADTLSHGRRGAAASGVGDVVGEAVRADGCHTHGRVVQFRRVQPDGRRLGQHQHAVTVEAVLHVRTRRRERTRVRVPGCCRGCRRRAGCGRGGRRCCRRGGRGSGCRWLCGRGFAAATGQGQSEGGENGEMAAHGLVVVRPAGTGPVWTTTATRETEPHLQVTAVPHGLVV